MVFLAHFFYSSLFTFPRYVNGLVACLYEYLNLSPENVNFQKVRQKYMQVCWALCKEMNYIIL